MTFGLCVALLCLLWTAFLLLRWNPALLRRCARTRNAAKFLLAAFFLLNSVGILGVAQGTALTLALLGRLLLGLGGSLYDRYWVLVTYAIAIVMLSPDRWSGRIAKVMDLKRSKN